MYRATFRTFWQRQYDSFTLTNAFYHSYYTVMQQKNKNYRVALQKTIAIRAAGRKTTQRPCPDCPPIIWHFSKGAQ
jgi:hypothetical protein